MTKHLIYSVFAAVLGLSGAVGVLSAQTLSTSTTGLVYDHSSRGDLTVVELFTSQGCSSCPPADQVLTTLADRPNILALSWAVDYWDRLGWVDTFSSPLYSKRQRAYNRRIGRRGVYTPQLFVNGVDQAVGSRRDEVEGALQASAKRVQAAIIPDISVDGDTITVMLPETDIDGMAAVQLVWFKAAADVAIGRGENRGRNLHYTNIVQDAKWSEDWMGDAKTITVPLSGLTEKDADCFAVLVQSRYADGPIIGASYIAFKDTSSGTAATSR